MSLSLLASLLFQLYPVLPTKGDESTTYVQAFKQELIAGYYVDTRFVFTVNGAGTIVRTSEECKPLLGYSWPGVRQLFLREGWKLFELKTHGPAVSFKYRSKVKLR